MTADHSWLDRLEILESRIETGETTVSQVLNPPPAMSIEDIRRHIVLDPPLEGEYIIKDLTTSPSFFVWLLCLSVLVTFFGSLLNRGNQYQVSASDVILSAIVALPCGIILSLVLSALTGAMAPWLLNTLIKPTDIEAATSRTYLAHLREQFQLRQAREDWLLGRSFEPWKRADGPTFEKLTARAFRRQGWKVQRVGGANDGGVDLRIRNGELLVVVQCKAHAKPVSPATVRELYGALLHEKAGGAILVCLSGASKAARNWALGKPILILTPEQMVGPNWNTFFNQNHDSDP